MRLGVVLTGMAVLAVPAGSCPSQTLPLAGRESNLLELYVNSVHRLQVKA